MQFPGRIRAISRIDKLQLTETLKDKRLLYWENVLKGIPLESIRYENLEPLNDRGNEELVCYGYSSDDSESDVNSNYTDVSDDSNDEC